MRILVPRTPLVCASILLALAAPPPPAAGQLDRLLEDILKPSPGGAVSGLSDVKIGAGLKEALQIGADNAVKLTGKTDGYFLNEAIKILMPSKLRSVERGLRLIGYGPQVDEFVLSMNRAAERAAPYAKQSFLDAIGEMTFTDARKILTGPNTAATDYLKAKTTDKLTVAFSPVVGKAMNEVGVTRQYKELVGFAQALPLVKPEAFDLDHYVVSKSLDGLFLVVGEEERKIRKDPVAQVTPLLKEVFGGLTK